MQDNLKKLVVCFVFNKDLKKVLLIHKNRPERQKGKVNGIGGKLKIGETKKAAIVREFFEETGVTIPANEWMEFGKMLIESEKIMYLFAAVYKDNISSVKTTTDEEIEWFSVNKLPSNIMTNLAWLIPLAGDKLRNDEVAYVTVHNNF
ncbi:MAG: NUDIX domain-containing protein [Patescibacteria group bacterium]